MKAEPKHTPGPCFNHDPLSCTLYADIGFGIIRGSSMMMSRAEFEKRSRIADAAPELLEALREWADDTGCESKRGQDAPRNGCDCWTCERVRKALAVIAKAEGRAE